MVMSARGDMKIWLVSGVAAIAVVTGGAASAKVTVLDGNFEAPLLAPGAYEYGVQNGAQHSSNGVDAKAKGATFGNGAGVQANGSAWGFADAPDGGSQTGFLQSYDDQTPGKITLKVTGLTPGKTYDISFFDADRPGYGVDPVKVSFDGDKLGKYTPENTSWNEVTTELFKATSTSGTITFRVKKNAGDADIGIDDVSVNAVPEPAAWALMMVGVGGAGAALRRSRSKTGRRSSAVAA
jgi:hypothetical protein